MKDKPTTAQLAYLMAIVLAGGLAGRNPRTMAPAQVIAEDAMKMAILIWDKAAEYA